MHINPDHFLQTAQGRVVTPERNREAWAQAYRALRQALARSPAPPVVYVLVGAQGSGKSTWVRAREALEPHVVFFDAIRVTRRERADVLACLAPFGVPAVAVWLNTPLDTCLERNRRRPADEVVPDHGLRNVWTALEPPTCEEGFVRVIEVPAGPPQGDA